MLTIFDIISITSILGFGLFGHLAGAIPATASIVIDTLSSILSVLLGSALAVTLGFRSSAMALLACILTLLIGISSIARSILIPKNLARILYIDTPLYYLSGAFIGAVRGYIFANIIFFCISFDTSAKVLSEIKNAMLNPIFTTTHHIWEYFIPNSILMQISLNRNLHKHTPAQNTNHIKQQVETDPKVESIKNILSKVESMNTEELDITSNMLNTLNKHRIEELHRRILGLSSKGILNKKVILFLIAHSYATEINHHHTIRSKPETDTMYKLALQHLINTSPDLIIYRHATKKEQQREKSNQPAQPQNNPISAPNNTKQNHKTAKEKGGSKPNTVEHNQNNNAQAIDPLSTY